MKNQIIILFLLFFAFLVARKRSNLKQRTVRVFQVVIAFVDVPIVQHLTTIVMQRMMMGLVKLILIMGIITLILMEQTQMLT